MSLPLDDLSQWIASQDLEKISYDKHTWIPLQAGITDIEVGKAGTVGYRESYRSIETLVVPLSERADFNEVDWQSLSRSGGTDGVWVDDERLRRPGHYADGSDATYPVILRSFDSGERNEWVLLQELEIGLRLLRVGDEWVCPGENDVVVIKLSRRLDGTPGEILIRAEHLRDYLCARKSALLICAFYFREAVEETFTEVPIKSERDETTFPTGEREIVHVPIHEGGTPFGMETAVLRAWRESVNPADDVPIMPHVTEDSGTGVESYTVREKGQRLHRLAARVWTKHWIEPAGASPRIRRDKVDSRVHFYVENQEQKTLAGDLLKAYRGWLWFKPSVISRLLAGRKSVLRWYTGETGEVGPAPNQTLHFGINKHGLINVLGYKMADLPEWVQRIWATDNVSPDGGLSEELHMSQNLAKPAHTIAPEVILWHNLNLLEKACIAHFGQGLFLKLPAEIEYYKRVHRFYGDSLESLCELCKELNRTITEQIDLGALNAKLDLKNATEANKQKLRQIKRLSLWMDTLGQDGRSITRSLAGVSELRQGDAHEGGSGLRDSLALFDIPADSSDYGWMGFSIIGSVANSIAQIGHAIVPKVIAQMTPPPAPKTDDPQPSSVA